jgi:hypothetical protein
MVTAASLGRKLVEPPEEVETSNCASAAYLLELSNKLYGLLTRSLPKESTLVPPRETTLSVEEMLTKAG